MLRDRVVNLEKIHVSMKDEYVGQGKSVQLFVRPLANHVDLQVRKEAGKSGSRVGNGARWSGPWSTSFPPFRSSSIHRTRPSRSVWSNYGRRRRPRPIVSSPASSRASSTPRLASPSDTKFGSEHGSSASSTPAVHRLPGPRCQWYAQSISFNSDSAHPERHLSDVVYPGYGPQPPPIANSPGPGGKGRGRGPPSASTPQQSQPMPYPGSPRGHGPTPPPAHHQRQVQPPPPQQYNQLPHVGNELTKLNVEELPNHLKTIGDDWFAIHNPAIRRQLDVRLLHSIQHTSVVCCVRFSLEGRHVATGCNRLAQIFEVETGRRVALLEDESGDTEGDLYIRSVCFSPDGNMLATGAEDKCIPPLEHCTGKYHFEDDGSRAGHLFVGFCTQWQDHCIGLR